MSEKHKDRNRASARERKRITGEESLGDLLSVYNATEPPRRGLARLRQAPRKGFGGLALIAILAAVGIVGGATFLWLSSPISKPQALSALVTVSWADLPGTIAAGVTVVGFNVTVSNPVGNPTLTVRPYFSASDCSPGLTLVINDSAADRSPDLCVAGVSWPAAVQADLIPGASVTWAFFETFSADPRPADATLTVRIGGA